MYDLSDTIVAVSSPGGGVRSIVRITGTETLSICEQIFDGGVTTSRAENLVLSGSVYVAEELGIDARLYLFFAPQSYTGEDLAEVHLHASPAIVEALVQRLLQGVSRGSPVTSLTAEDAPARTRDRENEARGTASVRLAGPGEFTARAYLNGKLDLAQAEAVNEIISSSNMLQLQAAEKLLGGRLTNAAAEIRSAMLETLSLIEAGLDFSGEDIEFVSTEQATLRLTDIQRRLEELLAGSIWNEVLMDLPAIGIAGAPNAGKSSLLNALLGWERSIVSPQPKTTRDVLSGVLTTDRVRCVLFDCAGLIRVRVPTCATSQVGPLPSQEKVLDELAQQAGIEALHGCRAVIFCVDSTKRDLHEDTAIRALIQPKSTVYVATKCDLLADDALAEKRLRLRQTFEADFLPVSAKTRSGLEALLRALEDLLMHGADSASPEPRHDEHAPPYIALTARHKQAVTEAIENLQQAIAEIGHGAEEVAVMMIRAAHQALSDIQHQPLHEQVLDRIFSRFCIGK
jgi:tRNA modification GTPase